MQKGKTVRHLELAVHVSKKAAQEAQATKIKQAGNSSGNVFTTHRDESRLVADYEVVESLTETNIPLEKLDHHSLHLYL